jgi:hypothetical protein
MTLLLAVASLTAGEEEEEADSVRENGIFEPFIYKNEHFAKTGSGQT